MVGLKMVAPEAAQWWNENRAAMKALTTYAEFVTKLGEEKGSWETTTTTRENGARAADDDDGSDGQRRRKKSREFKKKWKTAAATADNTEESLGDRNQDEWHDVYSRTVVDERVVKVQDIYGKETGRKRRNDASSSSSSGDIHDSVTCATDSYAYYHAQLSRILGYDEPPRTLTEETTTSTTHKIPPASVDDAMDVDDAPVCSTTVALFEALPNTNVVEPITHPKLTIILPAIKRKAPKNVSKAYDASTREIGGRYNAQPIPSVTCRWSVLDPLTNQPRECGKPILLHDEKGTSANSIINSHITTDPDHIRRFNAEGKCECLWPGNGSEGRCQKSDCGVEKTGIGKHITRGDHIFHEEWAKTTCPVCAKAFNERAGTDTESIYRHCKSSHPKESKVLFPCRTKKAGAAVSEKGKGKTKALEEPEEPVGPVRPRRGSLRQQRAGSVHPY
ncbi:hypothetical protein BKA70DRAFT_1571601 [Coprinopsis sp. MPI-PUGE-AT-0042]|nr:hypothetical protein BKA70DRAFT_1571601 [Coprinopsis sp. MPI-PUGE-AT-0042]